jgi:hypothetical protein
MLQKIIVASFVMLFVFTGTCFAESATTHIKYLEYMKNVPRIFGGLGGKITKIEDLTALQNLIDQYGIAGGKHRNNGSHDKRTVLKLNKPLIKLYKWDKWAVANAVCIHNILDMRHKGNEGTNGWKCNSKRKSQAKLLKDKLKKGERILRFPKWARKPGPMMKVTDEYKKFCENNYKKGAVTKPKPKQKTFDKLVKKLKFDKMFKKVSVVVKRVPYAGPIIYVTYEGVTFTYRVTKKGDINWEEEISNAISTTVGVGFAVMGAKVGLVVCAPLEAIPVAGPVLHIVGTAIVSIGCAFSGEYITSKSIQYVKITFI